MRCRDREAAQAAAHPEKRIIAVRPAVVLAPLRKEVIFRQIRCRTPAAPQPTCPAPAQPQRHALLV
eukprot:scaffold1727_cov119-Isochrysis_galbana.AAC.7